MPLDLTDWNDRLRFARQVVRRGPMKPNADHLTLLAAARWDFSETEFGAVEQNGKHSYGNSDVEDDLAELLPGLSPEDRLRRHCELPAVLAYIAAKAKEVQW
jgi:hypothetical protein